MDKKLIEKEKECIQLKQELEMTKKNTGNGIEAKDFPDAKLIIKEYIDQDYTRFAKELMETKLDKAIAVERLRIAQEKLKDLIKKDD